MLVLLRSIVVVLSCGLSFAASAAATPIETQRRAFADAWQQAQNDKSGRWKSGIGSLTDYPLYPYLEALALAQDFDHADAAVVQAFLDRENGSWLGLDLRRRWIDDRAGRRKYDELLAAWSDEVVDTELVCHRATALIEAKREDEVAPIVESLWTSGHALPAACDPAVGLWAKRGLRTDDRVWQRLEAATRERVATVARAMAALLPAAEQPAAQRWVAAIGDPVKALDDAPTWPNDERHRRLVDALLTKVAVKNAERIGKAWPALAAHFKFDAAQTARMLSAIAVAKAASYDADASTWLDKVPRPYADPRIADWRLRVALAGGDGAAALRALDGVAADQVDSRVHYLRGRLLEDAGKRDAARAEFAEAAKSTGFHGFLGADRVEAPYQLCGLDVARDGSARARVAASVNVVRSLEWWALGRGNEARRDWSYAAAKLSADDRRIAIDLAQQAGWLERGPYDLLSGDDVRYYRLRFPLGEQDTIVKQSELRGLDPAVVFGLVRAESAWRPDARSGADARGLMQLLPSVAKALAKREHLTYASAEDLNQPALNVALGTAHLADALAATQGRIDLAAATYNAGPVPVAKWQRERGALPADYWLETVPYKETRDYVARVIAFAAIYDWRLGRDTTPISERIGLASAGSPKKSFQCPPPADSKQKPKS